MMVRNNSGASILGSIVAAGVVAILMLVTSQAIVSWEKFSERVRQRTLAKEVLVGEVARLRTLIQSKGGFVVLIRGAQSLEGDWDPNPIITVDFNNDEQFTEWFEIPANDYILNGPNGLVLTLDFIAEIAKADTNDNELVTLEPGDYINDIDIVVLRVEGKGKVRDIEFNIEDHFPMAL